MRITPARRLKGNLRLPGDKSISHRAALIAGLARGRSQLTNFSTSSDCTSTLRCLAQLGVRIEQHENDVRIDGVGIGGLTAPQEALDCGNSGSTIRMLAGVLAGNDFTATLTGDKSLRSRPMRRIIEPLEMMGAAFESEAGHPPLRLTGRRPLTPISYELPVASAQVKSCVLLAGLHAHGRTEVVERLGGTRDHTERMLHWFGVEVEDAPNSDGRKKSCAVNGPANFPARNVNIPGDFSSAAFLIATAALLPGSEFNIEGVGLNPTRTQLLTVLRQVGANIETADAREVCNEPVGTLRIRGMETGGQLATRTAGATINGAQGPSPPLTIDGQLTAALIDELPLVAVIGTQIPSGLIIRDARELRFKESDRIAATVVNLRAMGAEVEEYDDGLMVGGAVQLRGTQLESFNDHRIAMAFSVAALLAKGESELAGGECVAISFPEFFELLESVTER